MANKKVFPRLLGAREMNKNRDTYSRALVSIIVRTAFFIPSCAHHCLFQGWKKIYFSVLPPFSYSHYVHVNKYQKREEKKRERKGKVFMYQKGGTLTTHTTYQGEDLC